MCLAPQCVGLKQFEYCGRVLVAEKCTCLFSMYSTIFTVSRDCFWLKAGKKLQQSVQLPGSSQGRPVARQAETTVRPRGPGSRKKV